jgi:hypothetical protein
MEIQLHIFLTSDNTRRWVVRFTTLRLTREKTAPVLNEKDAWVPHSHHESCGKDKLVLLPDIETVHSLFTTPATPVSLTGLIFIYWRYQLQRANIQRFITLQTPNYFQYISLKTKHNTIKTLQHAVELYQAYVHILYDMLVPFYDQPLPTFYCTFS